jgi:uncharacterized protein YutE (UPF0331/DUF86 family)
MTIAFFLQITNERRMSLLVKIKNILITEYMTIDIQLQYPCLKGRAV